MTDSHPPPRAGPEDARPLAGGPSATNEDNQKKRSAFILILAPTPAGLDAFGRDQWYRLKLAVKALKRMFGLELLTLHEVADPRDGKGGK